MIRVEQLREKAERLRHLAGIPTNGGALADRHLVDLADRLDKEADAWVECMKGQSEADKPA
jgi:hypothetical protein